MGLFSSETTRKQYAENFNAAGNGRFSMKLEGTKGRTLVLTDTLAINNFDLYFRIKDMGLKTAQTIFGSHGFKLFKFIGQKGTIATLNKDQFFNILN